MDIDQGIRWPSRRNPEKLLSASYQRRLERSGVTRAQYLGDVDLRTARGHARAVVEQEQRGRSTRRKGWDNLAESTQAKYRRAGIGRAQYEAGAPLPGSGRIKSFATEPPMPREAQRDLEAVGGEYAQWFRSGALDDVTAWSLAMSGTPPTDQWQSVDVLLSTGDNANTAIVHDTSGREWRILILAGHPTWTFVDWAKDIVKVPTSVGSP